ncbi:hypothetical protein [Rhizobacter fulvus]|jgi:hypothetical protein
MTEPVSLDPFALLRGLVSRLEKGINTRAHPLMQTDAFARNANRAMGAALLAKKLAKDLTQRYFEVLNVPSRTDVLALGDRVQALEDRLIEMQHTLDQIAGREAPRRPALPAPTRTRKPRP